MTIATITTRCSTVQDKSVDWEGPRAGLTKAPRPALVAEDENVHRHLSDAGRERARSDWSYATVQTWERDSSIQDACDKGVCGLIDAAGPLSLRDIAGGLNISST